MRPPGTGVQHKHVNQSRIRQTSFIFDGIPSPYPIVHDVNPTYIAVFPLMEIGQFFRGMYSSGMLGIELTIFFVYLYGTFFIVEGIKALVKSIRKKSLKNKNNIGSEEN